MSHESLVYAINLAIAALLAAILTAYWRRAGRGTGLGFWAAGAWTMTLADVLFALRPWLAPWAARSVPTLLVTVGLGVLLVAARAIAGRRPLIRAVAAVVAVHGLALAGFIGLTAATDWRIAVNGLVWSGLSLASYVTMRRVHPWPAAVSLGHAIFQAVRAGVALVDQVRPNALVADALQIAGDVEVSVFMVALFVSVLASHLTQRNDELRKALDEVRELSGLLPLCAWCRKVRDGEGYWQQVERYFSARSGVTFTHSICNTCLEEHFPDEAPQQSPAATQG